MRKLTGAVALFVLAAASVGAQTPDELIARYVARIGGLDKLDAIRTLRKTGKVTSGGGLEAKIVEENERPNLVRQEFILQGLVGVTASDGKQGWKIEPWQGKKDAEPLGEEEMKQILEDADSDGPLVRYREKGNRVELEGTEEVEGTDVYKLKVTLANGDVRYYFLDTEDVVPIRVETRRVIRGAERESETSIGDYKEVAGVYFPHSFETGARGSSNRTRTVYEKIEANVPIEPGRFRPPVVAPQPGGPR